MNRFSLDGLVESRGAPRDGVEEVVKKLNSAIPHAFTAEFDGDGYSLYASGKTVNLEMEDPATICADVLRALIRITPAEFPIESTLRCTEFQGARRRNSIFIFGHDVEIDSRMDDKAEQPVERSGKPDGNRSSIYIGVASILLLLAFTALFKHREDAKASNVVFSRSSDMEKLRGAFTISSDTSGNSLIITFRYKYSGSTEVVVDTDDLLLRHAIAKGDFHLIFTYENGSVVPFQLKYGAYAQDPVEVTVEDFQKIREIRVQEYQKDAL